MITLSQTAAIPIEAAKLKHNKHERRPDQTVYPFIHFFARYSRFSPARKMEWFFMDHAAGASRPTR